MVGKAIGILKNATANHETVDFGIFSMELEGVGTVSNISVNDKFGFGGDFITSFDTVRYEFIVGGDFAHFFFGAEMDGESGRMLTKKSWKPGFILVGTGPAKTGFDRNW